MSGGGAHVGPVDEKRGRQSSPPPRSTSKEKRQDRRQDLQGRRRTIRQQIHPRRRRGWRQRPGRTGHSPDHRPGRFGRKRRRQAAAARNSELAWNAAYATNAQEPKYPLMFQVSPPPAIWADLVIKRAMKTFPMKSVVLIVVPNDPDSGTDVASVDGEAHKANGVAATSRNSTSAAPRISPLSSPASSPPSGCRSTTASSPARRRRRHRQAASPWQASPVRDRSPGVGGSGRRSCVFPAGMDVLKDFYSGIESRAHRRSRRFKCHR